MDSQGQVCGWARLSKVEHCIGKNTHVWLYKGVSATTEFAVQHQPKSMVLPLGKVLHDCATDCCEIAEFCAKLFALCIRTYILLIFILFQFAQKKKKSKTNKPKMNNGSTCKVEKGTPKFEDGIFLVEYLLFLCMVSVFRSSGWDKWMVIVGDIDKWKYSMVVEILELCERYQLWKAWNGMNGIITMKDCLEMAVYYDVFFKSPLHSEIEWREKFHMKDGVLLQCVMHGILGRNPSQNIMSWSDVETLLPCLLEIACLVVTSHSVIPKLIALPQMKWISVKF
ncbi:hypothetical protein RFI_09192 [Reticulomyxa filosa]|uniref:Uncharacterized protein n=1 Tax=Reticulomyxa filosa TaxID=46433 RepID=X6NPV3_RETFI|nr:hypothetical protein RFI_09192 [Reticulomyxa filosa]|eukprot:ETO27943.1 hypothetical protein RFI_09192 [Reticulomyxa filosa]